MLLALCCVRSSLVCQSCGHRLCVPVGLSRCDWGTVLPPSLVCALLELAQAAAAPATHLKRGRFAVRSESRSSHGRIRREAQAGPQGATPHRPRSELDPSQGRIRVADHDSKRRVRPRPTRCGPSFNSDRARRGHYVAWAGPILSPGLLRLRCRSPTWVREAGT